MPEYLPLAGKRFGRLVVIRKHGFKRKQIAWLCKCDCGETKIVRGDYLRNGGTKSCGCFQLENQRSKGRWKLRKACCEICGRTFTYSASVAPVTCSKKCKRQLDADRMRTHRNGRDLESFVRDLTKGAKHRAKKQGMPCSITAGSVARLLVRQFYRCARTHISFELSDRGRSVGARSPWSPSLDQINPSGGYTVKNTQLVCLMYNLAKGTWTDNQVRHMAKSMCAQL